MSDISLDKIHIRDLRARCILGIFPEEREKPQEILLNIVLWGRLRNAGDAFHRGWWIMRVKAAARWWDVLLLPGGKTRAGSGPGVP